MEALLSVQVQLLKRDISFPQMAAVYRTSMASLEKKGSRRALVSSKSYNCYLTSLRSRFINRSNLTLLLHQFQFKDGSCRDS
jgi:hypothetical protein